MNTLPISPSDAIQIKTLCFSFDTHTLRTFYFSNLKPLDCHDKDDRQAATRMRMVSTIDTLHSNMVEILRP